MAGCICLVRQYKCFAVLLCNLCHLNTSGKTFREFSEKNIKQTFGKLGGWDGTCIYTNNTNCVLNTLEGFPGGASGKEHACNEGDL